MQIKVLKSKLHYGAITKNVPHYHGSVTIDPDLMSAVGLYPYEAVLVANVATGQRAETYALPGIAGSGQMELNGAMARIGLEGDRIILMSFATLDVEELPGYRPRVAILDERNRVVEMVDSEPIEAGDEAAAMS